MLKRTLAGWFTVLILLISGTYMTYAVGLPIFTSTPPQPDSDPEPITFSLAIRPDGSWEGEGHFHVSSLAPSGSEKSPDAQVQQEAAAIFGEHGIRYSLDEKEGVNYTFSLAGADAREIVELALDVAHVVKRPAGPVALDLGGFVRAGQTLVLTLSSNPSTGYSWGVETQAGSVLSQVNGVETYQVTQGLGTPARQIIRLRAMETGETGFRLLYRRPWQADLPPTVVVSIQPAGLNLADTCAALSAPPPPSSPIDAFGIQEEAPLGHPQQPASLSSAQSLPSTYNWCDANGGCTSIKNQGSCGSCWAFGTVGPLEALLQAAGQTTDLSEQYLVSCNTNGWGCDGGWWAHDYHEWKKPPSESAAGAVLESAFPYVASDDPCAGAYSHPHEIADWHYVGNSYSAPAVNAIKQTIYDHGPVAAAVCVDSAFQSYSGGVFNPGTTCNDINHAIVLVGWNDSEQTWILRNSWGSGWGENGYMRIRYGVSQVGYAANYVVYASAPPFVASNWVYLPSVLRNLSAAPATDLANGDFESGQDGSWTEFSSNGWDLILDAASLPTSPHGGSWAAWLGGDNDEDATLSQQVTVPSDAAALNYWYWIGSEDSCGYDYARVSFGSTTLQTHDLCESNNTGSWVFQQVDVTSWQGQTVELRFGVETDWILNSNFFLDDVSFSATTAALASSISSAPSADSAAHATAPKGSR